MSAIIGIDLGTANSSAYLYKNNKSQNLINNLDHSILSVVAWTDKDCLIGEEAKAKAITNPQRTIAAAKRLIGQKFNSPRVKSWCKNLPYSVIEMPDGEAGIKIGDKEYKPEEIMALLLSRIKSEAEAQLGESVTEAVISIPDYYNLDQIERIKAASSIAGLECKRIIFDTTASALVYSYGKNFAPQRIAVISFGAGAISVSIMEVGDGVIEAKSVKGDTFIGGEDIDRRIIKYLIDEFQKETGVDLSTDKNALQRLKEAAEKAKIDLSSLEETKIELPFITSINGVSHDLRITLTRSQLETFANDIVELLLPLCKKALEDAGLKPNDIQSVILTGGMTKMPLVRQTVEKIFGKDKKYLLQPTEDIGIGAAIQAGILAGEVKDILALDVIAQGIGIATKDEVLGKADLKKEDDNLLKRMFKNKIVPSNPVNNLTIGTEKNRGKLTKIFDSNTTIPTRKSQIFRTHLDNQSSVTIHVLQGENERAADNLSLGSFQLTSISSVSQANPQIDVAVDIDAYGIVRVTAKDLETGKEETVTINEHLQNHLKQSINALDVLLIPPAFDDTSGLKHGSDSDKIDNEGFGPKIHGLQLGLSKNEISAKIKKLQDKYKLVLLEEENEIKLISENDQHIQISIEFDENENITAFSMTPKIFNVKSFLTPKFLSGFKEYYRSPNLVVDPEDPVAVKEINEEENYIVSLKDKNLTVEQLYEEAPFFE